jgi:uncharacterized membrane protein
MGKGGKLVALVFQEASEGAVMMDLTGDGSGAAIREARPVLAEAALKEITAKAKEAGVGLYDAVIAYRTKEGRLKIQQTKDMTAGKGAGRGAFWGLLVGLILGGPLLGAVAGLGIGALWGRKADHGLKDDFVKDLTSSLKYGNSALLLWIDRALKEEGIEYLESFNAELHIADVSEEMAEAVSHAAEDGSVAQAVEAEVDSD